jgi:hypothetical protein
MRIRRYRSEDALILDQWKDPAKHGYGELELSGPDVVVTHVLVDDDDMPRAALRAKKCVEITLVIDPEWETPASRFAALKSLAREIYKTCYTLGYRTAFCWLEDTMTKAYPRRLKTLGMMPDARRSYRLEVE